MVALSPIIPVILSGGSGSRLWPVSTPQKPKPFLRFNSGHTLLQQTLARCQSALFDCRPIIIASTLHRPLLEAQLQQCGIAAEIALEPESRDSCAAALTGAMLALQRDPQAVVLMLAADHHIPDVQAFTAAVAAARCEAEAGHIVSFGIKATSPATGYGYILPNQALGPGAMAPVQRFAEKPDATTAATYVASGYFWNSGNLLFKAAALVTEAQTHAPHVVSAVAIALWKSQRENDCWSLNAAAYRASPNLSIDYAVLEKTDAAWVMAVDYDWSDIGTWDAIAELQSSDNSGNACTGNAFVAGGRNNFVQAGAQRTILSQVDDLLVITTEDAILITRKGQGQSVKELAAKFADDYKPPTSG